VTGLVAPQSGSIRDPFYRGSLVGLTNFTSPAVASQLNRLPAGRLDANGVKLLNLYPLPNLGGFSNDYAYDSGFGDDTSGVDLRVDHNFSDRDQMFVFASWWHRPSGLPISYPGVAGDAGKLARNSG